MKILHLANTAGRASGGIGDVAHELFQRQRDQGADVTLWFPGDGALEAEVIEITGGNKAYVHAIPRRRPLALWEAMKNAAGFDLIHQHGIWLTNSLITAGAGRTPRRIISPHGLLEPERLKYSARKKWLVGHIFENRNLAGADCLGACSQQEVEGFRLYGLCNPTAIVPNGVADELLAERADHDVRGNRFRATHGLARSSKIILCLSRIDRIKGLETLLEAVSLCQQELRRADWVLVIAGGGETGYLNQLERLTISLNISDIVDFVGPLYEEQKTDAYCAADIFALTSRNENFGIVVAEALAMAVPVLVSDRMPWSDVESMGCGLITEIDAGSVAKKLESLVELSDEARKAMGTRGRDYAVKNFHWDTIARAYLNIYHRQLARNSFVEIKLKE